MVTRMTIPANELAPEYMVRSRDASREIGFTAQQLQHLETVFPEILDSSVTEATLRHRLGQRSVMAYIKSKVPG